MTTLAFGSGRLTIKFFLLALSISPLSFGQTSPEINSQSSGIAWQVKGGWKDVGSGRRVHSGDGIRAGALLAPDPLQGPHSITMLLSDGQRVLSECFSPDDCSRGFRVPLLAAVPPAFNRRMLASIGAALVRRTGEVDHVPVQAYVTSARENELVSAIQTERKGDSLETNNSRVDVSAVLSDLPNGSYHYDLRPLNQKRAIQAHLPFEKVSSTCILPIPSAGLYQIAIWDSLDHQRVDLSLAVVNPQDFDIGRDFSHAQQLLKSWDDESYGWPVHSLLRAYLQSLVEQRAMAK